MSTFIISVSGVLIGSIITYFLNYKIEKKKFYLEMYKETLTVILELKVNFTDYSMFINANEEDLYKNKDLISKLSLEIRNLQRQCNLNLEVLMVVSNIINNNEYIHRLIELNDTFNFRYSDDKFIIEYSNTLKIILQFLNQELANFIKPSFFNF